MAGTQSWLTWRAPCSSSSHPPLKQRRRATTSGRRPAAATRRRRAASSRAAAARQVGQAVRASASSIRCIASSPGPLAPLLPPYPTRLRFLLNPATPGAAGIKVAVRRFMGGFDEAGLLADDDDGADAELSGVDAREAARRAADPINAVDIPSAGVPRFWNNGRRRRAPCSGCSCMGCSCSGVLGLAAHACLPSLPSPAHAQCARCFSAWRRSSRR